MADNRLNDLFHRFIERRTSDAENKELMQLMANDDHEAQVIELMEEAWDGFEPRSEPFSRSDSAKQLHQIWGRVKVHPGKKFRLWPRIAIAASVILAMSFGSYLLLHKQPVQQLVQNQTHDLLPGGNKATLTLSNGQKISLSDAKNGNIAQQLGTQVKKARNGQIVYIVNNAASGSFANERPAEMVYNTVSTPRGGQWQLTLPDGSRVWLNASSSITFPTAFSGTSRSVKITGEAYFEVVHNAAKPFRVTTKDQTIEDIGTHFNINAYDDEGSIRTTLVEGSVKVSNITGSATLLPGQQSVINQANNKIVVNVADMEEAIAWKNGLFHFDRANIQTVMREFARWYDVDVQYKGNIPVRAFAGNIDRNSKASVALQILSIEGVHFRIEGKKIIVQP